MFKEALGSKNDTKTNGGPKLRGGILKEGVRPRRGGESGGDRISEKGRPGRGLGGGEERRLKRGWNFGKTAERMKDKGWRKCPVVEVKEKNSRSG